MPRPALPVLAVLSIAVAACAPAARGTGVPSATTAPPRPCFSQSQITNFRQGPDQKVYLRLMNRDVVELRSPGCDLGIATAIRIVQARGPSGRVCIGDDVRVLNDGNDLVNVPCRARVTRTLTPAEVEALAPRDRP